MKPDLVRPLLRFHVTVFIHLSLVDKMRFAKKSRSSKAKFLAAVAISLQTAATAGVCVIASATEPVNKFRQTPANSGAIDSLAPNERLPRLPDQVSALPVRQETRTARATTNRALDTRGAVILNSRKFDIPFNVDQTGPRPTEVRLFVNVGGKNDWEMTDRKPPTVQQFQFKGTKDGLYWFATRTVDRSGQLHPASVLSPQLKVVIDTTKPNLKLNADADAAGGVKANVRYTDSTPIKSIQIHYATDVLRKWTSLSPSKVDADGNLNFAPKQNWQQLSLQVIVMDSAGNKAIETKLLQRPRIAIGIPPKYASSETPSARNAVFESPTEGGQQQIQTVAGPNELPSVYVSKDGAPPSDTRRNPSASDNASLPKQVSTKPQSRIAQAPKQQANPYHVNTAPLTGRSRVQMNQHMRAIPAANHKNSGPATAAIGGPQQPYQPYQQFGPPSLHVTTPAPKVERPAPEVERPRRKSHDLPKCRRPRWPPSRTCHHRKFRRHDRHKYHRQLRAWG